jgi:magnesium-transporting ATPase (P-type)
VEKGARAANSERRQSTILEISKSKNISGNPSEVAMLRYASEIIDVHNMRDSYEIVFEIPFNSVRKWHLVICKRSEDQEMSVGRLLAVILLLVFLGAC